MSNFGISLANGLAKWRDIDRSFAVTNGREAFSERVERPPLLTDQFTKIDVDRSAKSLLTRKPLFLLVLDVPKRVADVLEMEFHTAAQEVRPLAAPISEEMAMRTLARFAAARAGERLLLRSLEIGRKCKYTKTTPQSK